MTPRIGRTPTRPEPARPARRAWALLALLWWLPAACAGPKSPEPAQEYTSAFFWRVDGGPAAGEFYLLGSVHLRPEGSPPLAPVIIDAYLRAQELVVEVDVGQVSPAQMVQLLMRFGTLPPEQTLADVLPEETYAKLAAFLAVRGVPLASIERFEPWVVALQIDVMRFQEAGFQPELGVDKDFIDRAAGDKPIVPLESADYQLSLFDSLPPDLQVLMLEDALSRAEGEGEDALASLVDAWRRGDEDELIALTFGPLETSPELAPLYDRIFFARNEQMAERLTALSRDGVTRFAVIGAGHVVGPRGIPTLLRSQGFRVERLR